jgi:hypothetical protein
MTSRGQMRCSDLARARHGRHFPLLSSPAPGDGPGTPLKRCRIPSSELLRERGGWMPRERVRERSGGENDLSLRTRGEGPDGTRCLCMGARSCSAVPTCSSGGSRMTTNVQPRTTPQGSTSQGASWRLSWMKESARALRLDCFSVAGEDGRSSGKGESRHYGGKQATAGRWTNGRPFVAGGVPGQPPEWSAAGQHGAKGQREMPLSAVESRHLLRIPLAIYA